MTLLFSSLHRLSLGLLLGVGLITLSACDELSRMTSETAVSPSPAAPATPSPAPAAPASVTPVAPAASAPTPQSPQASPAAGNSIAATAAGNPAFSTLAAAVQAAGLTEVLAQPGALTVFAPTNDAFNALPPATLQALLRPENKAALTQILTYHVVPQKVTAAQITAIDLPTVEGQPLKIRPANGVVKVNDATVTQADVLANNGVIHAINQVLLPPNFAPAQLK